MKKVVFVCTHNAGRSQMAETFFNLLASGKAIATSAGVAPEEHVGPQSTKAMLEIGIDIRHKKPQLLTADIIKDADRVINMGCHIEEAGVTIDVPTEDWALDDPKGKPMDEVRQIRDRIRAKVEELIRETT
jgi:arsenate reductase